LFASLKEWPEIQRAGVYLLFGADEETGEDIAYVGEAEIVLDRLNSHVAEKDFWTEVVVFTNKDENLTKAHVKYLESKLIMLAREAARYKLENFASPSLPALPRADRDAMDEYLASIRTLLGVLGHRLLEPLVRKEVRLAIEGRRSPASSAVRQLTLEECVPTFTFPPTEEMFFLKVGDISASALWNDDGMVVLESSMASRATHPSLTRGAIASREALIATGVLVEERDHFVFSKHHAFKSPSQAASVVVGYSINGRESWKRRDGTTFNQLFSAPSSKNC
jgi:hypothetical protein